MSRSAADATRFTAASPHAYSQSAPINRASPSTFSARAPRSNPSARTPPPPIDPKKGALGGAPPRETPLEKVARLRQERIRQRAAELTRWDRAVIIGRVWADRAHKVTVYSLVGFGVIAGAITIFSVTDMFIHNRNKRHAFFAEQASMYGSRLIEAIEAEKAGLPLSEDLASVLKRERAKVQAAEANKERSWSQSIRRFFVEDLKNEEEYEDKPEPIESEEQVLQRFGVDRMSILQQIKLAEKGSGAETADADNSREEGNKDGSGILQAVAEKRREGEKAMDAAGVRGGPLDRMAAGAAEAVGGEIQTAEEKVGSKGGWTTWWTGK